MGEPLDHGFVDALWAGIFTAIVGGFGWLVNRSFSRMDKRHERAEDKFEEHDDRLAEHDTKIALHDEKFIHLERNRE